ncbi:MAG: hypothetical protein KDA60_12035 [Planctomycetales bacterium]|nr:hypothetical protein [Planctomycetales bacterium]
MKRRVLVSLLVICACTTQGWTDDGAISLHPTDRASASGRNARWQLASTDCTYQILAHRAEQSADSEQPYDRLVIRSGHGTFLHAVHDIRPTPILAELSVSTEMRSDHDKLQLLVRAVLPRSLDPTTKRPITVLLGGALYDRQGNWQRLEITDIPQKLERQVRVLRAQWRTPIDTREAYVDMVVANIYGGAGTTQTDLQRPLIDGIVLAEGVEWRPGPRIAGGESGHEFDRRDTTSPPRVRLDGDVLLVDERPFFARMVDLRGEDFAFLRQLGFNTIRLGTSPTREQLETAERLDLWLVCPPPRAESISVVGPGLDRILAWHLGESLTQRHLEATTESINGLRDSALLEYRPVLGVPDTELLAYGRRLDIVLHQREPLGTSFPLSEFSSWLVARRQLCRPGVTHWATIQTEMHPLLEQQASALGYSGEAVSAEPEQIRKLVFSAVGSGMRGLHFRSLQRLDDPTQHLRALTIRLLLHELDQLTPWIAGGRAEALLASAAGPGRPGTRVSSLRTSRSILVVASQHDAYDQLVTAGASRTPARVIVRGAPAASQLFEITPAGPRPQEQRRVAGGTQITIAPYQDDAVFAFVHDPVVLRSLAAGLSDRLTTTAQLRSSLAALYLQHTQKTFDQLQKRSATAPASQPFLDIAAGNVKQSAILIRQNDLVSAEQQAREALAHIAKARRVAWQQASQAFASAAANPLCSNFEYLPAHWAFTARLSRASSAVNVLPGGSFEDFDQLIDDGWRSIEHAPGDVDVGVSLSSESAFAGERCLRLTVRGENATVAASVIEAAPVWVNSPPILMSAGQVFVIRGKVKIPEPIRGSDDGLMIFDSIAGPALGARFVEATDWQSFELYRACPTTQKIQVTIALPGIGTAYIDELTVHPLTLPDRARDAVARTR